jgi:hypothetical protein
MIRDKHGQFIRGVSGFPGGSYRHHKNDQIKRLREVFGEEDFIKKADHLWKLHALCKELSLRGKLPDELKPLTNNIAIRKTIKACLPEWLGIKRRKNTQAWHLIKHRFPSGISGNPTGRPKGLLYKSVRFALSATGLPSHTPWQQLGTTFAEKVGEYLCSAMIEGGRDSVKAIKALDEIVLFGKTRNIWKALRRVRDEDAVKAGVSPA